MEKGRKREYKERGRKSDRESKPGLAMFEYLIEGRGD